MMRNIFLGMSVWGFLFLIGSGVLGWLSAHSDASYREWHLDWGLLTAGYHILLHSIIFVHMLGTGLGVKRAVAEHRLPEEPIFGKLRVYKMKVFPPAFACMVITIMTAVAGGAVLTEALSSPVHRYLGIGLLVANLVTVPIELRIIDKKARLMDEVEALIQAGRDTAVSRPSSAPKTGGVEA